MKIWVASRTGNRKFALDPDNIIAVCATGINPQADARSYAFDHTQTEDEPSFVYSLDLKAEGGYKVHKEVVAFGSAE